jgi:hypothetical protein
MLLLDQRTTIRTNTNLVVRKRLCLNTLCLNCVRCANAFFSSVEARPCFVTKQSGRQHAQRPAVASDACPALMPSHIAGARHLPAVSQALPKYITGKKTLMFHHGPSLPLQLCPEIHLRSLLRTPTPTRHTTPQRRAARAPAAPLPPLPCLGRLAKAFPHAPCPAPVAKHAQLVFFPPNTHATLLALAAAWRGRHPPRILTNFFPYARAPCGDRRGPCLGGSKQ